MHFENIAPDDVIIAHDGMRYARATVTRIEDLTTEQAQAVVQWIDGVKVHKGEETITLAGQIKRLEAIDIAEYYGVYELIIETSRRYMQRKGLSRAHRYYCNIVSQLSDAVSIERVPVSDSRASAIQEALQADGRTDSELSKERPVWVTLNRVRDGVEVGRVVSGNELIDRAAGHVSRVRRIA